MTQKDYLVLANALLKAKSNTDAWQRTVCNVADALKSDNPRFNANIFFNACGTQDYRGKVWQNGLLVVNEKANATA